MDLLYTLLVPGLIIAVGLVIFLWDLLRRKRCTEKTTAIITYITDASDPEYSKYTPHLEYYVDGERIVRKGQSTSSSTKYHVGQRVEIYYNPKKPKVAYIKKSASAYITGLFIVGIGIIALVMFVLHSQGRI